VTWRGEPRHAHKDVRHMAEWLKSLGFVFVDLDAAGHAVYGWSTGETVKLPTTPRGHVWVDNTRKAAARIAGIDITNKRDARSIKQRQAESRERVKQERDRERERKRREALDALRKRNHEVERAEIVRQIESRRRALADIERLMKQRPDGWTA
jgi:hypothetical protein